MPLSALKVSTDVRDVIRRLHPELKRKVRAALADILADPPCGKALKDELEGYWSLRVGRSRIIYRIVGVVIEIVAVGPRDSIYEETALKLHRDREGQQN